MRERLRLGVTTRRRRFRRRFRRRQRRRRVGAAVGDRAAAAIAAFGRVARCTGVAEPVDWQALLGQDDALRARLLKLMDELVHLDHELVEVQPLHGGLLRFQASGEQVHQHTLARPNGTVQVHGHRLLVSGKSIEREGRRRLRAVALQAAALHESVVGWQNASRRGGRVRATTRAWSDSRRCWKPRQAASCQREGSHPIACASVRRPSQLHRLSAALSA